MEEDTVMEDTVMEDTVMDNARDRKRPIFGHNVQKISGPDKLGFGDALDDPLIDNGPIFEAPQLEYQPEAEVATRVNPTISAISKTWREVHKSFKKQLGSSDSIAAILARSFTQYEARVFTPTDSPQIQKVQKQNTKRYHALLEGRFKGVERDLATKMTMMYFGFPVEAMPSVMDDLMKKLETREPEGDRYVVEPPLHFLGAHQKRNWGRAELEGRAPMVNPVPIPQPERLVMSLRGGGHDSDSEEDNDDEDLPDAENNLSDAEGPLEQVQSKPAMSLKGGKAAGPEWVYLYGYQGAMPVNLTYLRDTLAAAIDKLLWLRPRTFEQVSLIHYDKKKPSKLQVMHDVIPLRDTSAILNFFRAHYAACRNPDETALFIKMRDEPEPASEWEPGAAAFQSGLSKIIYYPYTNDLDVPVSPPAMVYVSFPDPKQFSSEDVEKWGCNQYRQYMRQAVDVLVGRLPDDQMEHHAMIRMTDTKKRKPGLDEPEIYGFHAIRPSDMVKLYPSNKFVKETTLKLHVDELDEEEIPLILPNFYPANHLFCTTSIKFNPVEFEMGTYQEASHFFTEIRKAAVAFLEANEDRVSELLVYVGNGSRTRIEWQEEAPMEIPMKGDFPQEMDTKMAKKVMRAVKGSAPAIYIYPQLKPGETRIYDGNKPATELGARPNVEMPSIEGGLRLFRRSLKELFRMSTQPPGFDLDIYQIHIQPFWAASKCRANPHVEFSNFVLNPDTTEEEYFEMRTSFTADGIYVQCLPSAHVEHWAVNAAESAQVWGPRYGIQRTEYSIVMQPTHIQYRGPALEEFDELEDDITEADILVPAEPETGSKKSVRFKEVIIEPTPSPTEPQHRDTGMAKSVIPGSDPFTDENEELHYLDGKPTAAETNRLKAWSQQPSIFDNAAPQGPRRSWEPHIPLHAPPAEDIFRSTSGVPMSSKAVLTPSEIVQLKKNFWEIRNIALKRTSTCMYEGCDFAYKEDEEKEIKEHLMSKHLAIRCMWCDEPMYQWWNDIQRDKHLRHKHRDKLMSVLGVVDAKLRHHSGHQTVTVALKTAVQSPSEQGKQQVRLRPAYNPFPPIQAFCDRCGGDFASFSIAEEKAHHDRNCRPGVYHGAKCTFCVDCGGFKWASKSDALRSNRSRGELNNCGHEPLDRRARFCNECGFEIDILNDTQRRQHYISCRGYGSRPARFCEECCLEFEDQGNDDANIITLDEHREVCGTFPVRREWKVTREAPVRVEVPDVSTGELIPSSSPATWGQVRPSIENEAPVERGASSELPVKVIDWAYPRSPPAHGRNPRKTAADTAKDSSTLGKSAGRVTKRTDSRRVQLALKADRASKKTRERLRRALTKIEEAYEEPDGNTDEISQRDPNSPDAFEEPQNPMTPKESAEQANQIAKATSESLERVLHQIGEPYEDLEESTEEMSQNDPEGSEASEKPRKPHSPKFKPGGNEKDSSDDEDDDDGGDVEEYYDENGDLQTQPRQKKKRRRYFPAKPTRPTDKRYRYESDEDVDDDLQPDEDDLNPAAPGKDKVKSQVKESAKKTSSSKGKDKNKKPVDRDNAQTQNVTPWSTGSTSGGDPLSGKAAASSAKATPLSVKAVPSSTRAALPSTKAAPSSNKTTHSLVKATPSSVKAAPSSSRAAPPSKGNSSDKKRKRPADKGSEAYRLSDDESTDIDLGFESDMESPILKRAKTAHKNAPSETPPSLKSLGTAFKPKPTPPKPTFRERMKETAHLSKRSSSMKNDPAQSFRVDSPATSPISPNSATEPVPAVSVAPVESTPRTVLCNPDEVLGFPFAFCDPAAIGCNMGSEPRPRTSRAGLPAPDGTPVPASAPARAPVSVFTPAPAPTTVPAPAPVPAAAPATAPVPDTTPALAKPKRKSAKDKALLVPVRASPRVVARDIKRLEDAEKKKVQDAEDEKKRIEEAQRKEEKKREKEEKQRQLEEEEGEKADDENETTAGRGRGAARGKGAKGRGARGRGALGRGKRGKK